MSQFNTYGSGNPAGVAQPGSTVENYLDTANNTQWYNVGSGYQPETGMIAKANDLGITTAQTVLTITAPVSGLYQVFVFAAQATATSVTLPSWSITYTDLDTGVSATTTVTGTATTGKGQSQSAVATINAAAGTTVTIATTSTPAATVNVKARIASLG